MTTREQAALSAAAQSAYVVENRHRSPVSVQVLEAARGSVDEQVRVGIPV